MRRRRRPGQELHRYGLSWPKIAFSTVIFAFLLTVIIGFLYSGFVVFRRAGVRAADMRTSVFHINIISFYIIYLNVCSLWSGFVIFRRAGSRATNIFI